jgi:hypothetical protein
VLRELVVRITWRLKFAFESTEYATNAVGSPITHGRSKIGRLTKTPTTILRRPDAENPPTNQNAELSVSSYCASRSITAINVGHTTEQPVFAWGQAPRKSTCYACEVSILDNSYYITNEDNAAIGTIGGEYD